jgi:CRP-like cAMP-binding protein
LSTRETTRLEREIMLRSAFPSMPEAAYARIVELMQGIDADAGQVLFSEGEAAEYLYFLTKGRVVLESDGEPPWFFDPVAIIGIFDATLERPRRRRCTVLEPSTLFALESSEWFDMLGENPQIARGAIRNFATALHQRWRARVVGESRVGAETEEPPPRTLDPFDKLLVLRQAAFVERAGMQALVSLASVAESVVLRRGETVARSAGDVDYLYLVASGVIELTQGEDFRVYQGKGELLGGPGGLCRALAEYAARAVSDAVLVRIAEHDFYDRAEEHPRLTLGALAYLANELEGVMRRVGTQVTPAELGGAP